MSDENVDRRVQRTRNLLRSALMQLIQEKGYDAVTIQDITERANLGRTTFYLHYQSKDELLLDHHAEFLAHLNLEKLSREQILGDTPQPEMVTFLQLTAEGERIYLAFTQAKDADIIMRGIRERTRENLQQSLQEAFPDVEPNMPLPILTQYIVGAELALIDWWMLNRKPYGAAQLAAMLHQLRRAAVCDAYGIKRE